MLTCWHLVFYGLLSLGVQPLSSLRVAYSHVILSWCRRPLTLWILNVTTSSDALKAPPGFPEISLWIRARSDLDLWPLTADSSSSPMGNRCKTARNSLVTLHVICHSEEPISVQYVQRERTDNLKTYCFWPRLLTAPVHKNSRKEQGTMATGDHWFLFRESRRLKAARSLRQKTWGTVSHPERRQL